MTFKRFVEVGRVIYIANGSDAGKICAIVDVIDQNRALVDGPLSGVKRQALHFRNVHLTRFKIRIAHSCHSRYVKKAWEKGNINELWKESKWAQKLEDKKKRELVTDYERFTIGRAKCTRNRLVKRTFKKLRSQAYQDNKMRPKHRKHQKRSIKLKPPVSTQ